MNKRLQKKKKARTVGMSRRKLREENRVLCITCDILKKGQEQLETTIIALESKLKDCKQAHYLDYSANEKEVSKLKQQNRCLSNANRELSSRLFEQIRENNTLTDEMRKLKERTVFERIINKGVCK